MRSSQSRFALVAALASIAFAAGCGGSSGPSVPKDPKGELRASVQNLADSDVLTMTFGLDTTPTSLQAYAAGQGSTLSTADATAISGAQLVIEAQSTGGKSFSDASSGKKTNVVVRADANGSTLLELRVVDGDLYLQGHVAEILDLVHQSKAYAEVKARAKTLPAFVQAAVNGQWVSIDGAAAKGLAGSFAGGVQSPDADKSKQLLDDLSRIFSTDVVVTKKGSDAAGDHLLLTGDTRKLATDFLQAVSGVVPAGQAALGQIDPSKVPSKQIAVDAWVKDGVLSKLSLDVGQFQDAKSGKPAVSLPVVLTFEQSGDDVSKPSDATPVNLSQLGGLLGGLGSM